MNLLVGIFTPRTDEPFLVHFLPPFFRPWRLWCYAHYIAIALPHAGVGMGNSSSIYALLLRLLDP